VSQRKVRALKDKALALLAHGALDREHLLRNDAQYLELDAVEFVKAGDGVRGGGG
jgi:hypothetical protein